MISLLAVLVFIYSLIRKEYRYTIAAGFSMTYFVSYALQSNDNLIEYSQVLGMMQKAILVGLALYMIFASIKSPVKKTDILGAVLACIACIFRLVRTFVFDSYTASMQASGTDILTIYQEFSAYYVLIDSVTKLAILIMLFLFAWHLGKPKSANN